MSQIFSMMGFGRHEGSGTPEERAAVLEQHAKTSTDPEAVAAKDATRSHLQPAVYTRFEFTMSQLFQ